MSREKCVERMFLGIQPRRSHVWIVIRRTFLLAQATPEAATAPGRTGLWAAGIRGGGNDDDVLL